MPTPRLLTPAWKRLFTSRPPSVQGTLAVMLEAGGWVSLTRLTAAVGEMIPPESAVRRHYLHYSELPGVMRTPDQIVVQGRRLLVMQIVHRVARSCGRRLERRWTEAGVEYRLCACDAVEVEAAKRGGSSEAEGSGGE